MEKFKCQDCGSFLVYGAMNKKPSIWAKAKRYRNFFILLGVAIAIVLVKAAPVVTAAYWLVIAAVLVSVLILWLRGKNFKISRPRNNRFNNQGVNRNRSFNNHRPSAPYGNDRPGSQKMPSNVIPFRKRDEVKSRAKQDR